VPFRTGYHVTLLTEEEAYALLARFAHRIRFALCVASYTAFDGSEQQLQVLAKVIGGVAFSPQAEVPPPDHQP